MVNKFVGTPEQAINASKQDKHSTWTELAEEISINIKSWKEILESYE